ncbi:hypothetical protein RclHR1_16560002 [Rhizophagus clarus]|uniref:Reverse transcriptase domain-containing protein n=1 Tax=Rhizophagus clarus TaxID=94130 RepID=A0A2Z6QYI7_9GLOM|nr:hypothetical protein RclHR1_16560002 [Rhizophagus clarus]
MKEYSFKRRSLVISSFARCSFWFILGSGFCCNATQPLFERNIDLLDAIITDANSYAAIVGNDWLRKTKAILDYNNNMMTIEWNGEVLEAVTEYRGMPQHIVNIKALNVEAEEEAEEEVEDEVEESKKDCLKTEDLKEGNFIENKYSYQYEEIEKGKIHTGKLNNQQHTFNGFMKRYKNLFAWNSDDFKRTSVITYTIDTGDALSIKQRFCWTSCQNQLFIKKKIQQLLKTGLTVPLSSKWTSSIALVKKKNDKKRLCIDCCINKIMKKDSYPLHKVDYVLETLSGAQQFSSLDLASWFWQVELSKKDHEKSTFIIRFRMKMAPYECILEDLCWTDPEKDLNYPPPYDTQPSLDEEFSLLKDAINRSKRLEYRVLQLINFFLYVGRF